MLAFAICSEHLCLHMQLDDNETLCLWNALSKVCCSIYKRKDTSYNSFKTSKLGVCCAVVFFCFSKKFFPHASRNLFKALSRVGRLIQLDFGFGEWKVKKTSCLFSFPPFFFFCTLGTHALVIPVCTPR